MSLGSTGHGGSWGSDSDGGVSGDSDADVEPARKPGRRGLGFCFVATAAYGSPLAEDINRFRQFRDEYLVGNEVGEAFLDLYYGGAGEAAAEYLEEHEAVKETVRGLLEGTAEFLELLQDDWDPEEYEPSDDWEELRNEL